LLNFAYSELLESQKKPYTNIAEVFETLLKALEDSVTNINAKYDAERTDMLAAMKEAADALEKDSEEWDGERREREREKQKERDMEIQVKVEEARMKDLRDAREAWSLTYIVYMRAARRIEVRPGF
jgi:peptidoglycan hydrolase CwlO-like protein